MKHVRELADVPIDAFYKVSSGIRRDKNGAGEKSFPEKRR
jgi:hypothetical protein